MHVYQVTSTKSAACYQGCCNLFRGIYARAGVDAVRQIHSWITNSFRKAKCWGIPNLPPSRGKERGEGWLVRYISLFCSSDKESILHLTHMFRTCTNSDRKTKGFQFSTKTSTFLHSYHILIRSVHNGHLCYTDLQRDTLNASIEPNTFFKLRRCVELIRF